MPVLDNFGTGTLVEDTGWFTETSSEPTIFDALNTSALCDYNQTLCFNNTFSDTVPIERSSWTSILDTVTMAGISLVLGLMILGTVIGNVFVIAAILVEKNLQNVANYLIVSLAVADLMVACLVMPLGAVYVISQDWTLGPELCEMWTSCDVLCCTASILHLVAIAIDRYWAVTDIDYVNTRTTKRIILMIVLVWTVALIVSLAPQFGWKDPDYLTRINEQKCLVSQDMAYQIFATCSTFYVPLVVILILYWRIFQTARARIRKSRTSTFATPLTQVNPEDTATRTGGFLSRQTFSRLFRRSNPEGGTSQALGTSSMAMEGPSTATIELGLQSGISTAGAGTGQGTTAFTIARDPATGETTQETSFSGPSPRSGPSATPRAVVDPVRAQREKKESLEAKREKKAAQTLAIITGAFVICWLPFFVMAVVTPAVGPFSDHLANFFLWLGYFNSTLNPVIYTIFNPEFRQAFKKILFGTGRNQNFRYGRGR